MAVLGPIPLTPGILSELSPISALRSTTFSGFTPNFSLTDSSSISKGAELFANGPPLPI